VGSAAVQIAKLFQATVIATVGSDAKVDRARRLGADHVINWRREDVYQATKKLTSGKGVDVVVEHVGTAIWDKVVKTLGRDGRLVTCGATTGPQVSLDLRHVFVKQQSILGSYMGTKGDLGDALRMVEKGLLRPVVDSVFRLEEASEAHRRLESGEHFGKVVLSLE
jgi:NADPH:quinone reductase-like Zn-dependent oxidoreductase